MDQVVTPEPQPAEAQESSVALRAAVRESMLLMATLRAEADAGRPAIALRVRNLSAGGLMAECDRRMSVGELVAVELRGVGEVTGVVAWVAGPRFGVRFDREIDPKATRKPVGAGMQTSRLLVSYDTRRPGLR